MLHCFIFNRNIFTQPQAILFYLIRSTTSPLLLESTDKALIKHWSSGTPVSSHTSKTCRLDWCFWHSQIANCVGACVFVHFRKLESYLDVFNSTMWLARLAGTQQSHLGMDQNHWPEHVWVSWFDYSKENHFDPESIQRQNVNQIYHASGTDFFFLWCKLLNWHVRHELLQATSAQTQCVWMDKEK